MSLNDIKKSVGIIVQARMGSTRLPGKVLMVLFDGESVLSYLLARLLSCVYAHKVIVAITTNPKDDILEQWLERHGHLYYRGSEEDCLDRFYRAACAFDIDVIVRITSDCPFIVPGVVDEMIQYYTCNQNDIDYLSNRQYTNYPEGLDVEIFNRTVLEEAAQNATSQREREHINYYFLDRGYRYKIRYFNGHCVQDYSRFKLSIDTIDDLEHARQFFYKKKLPVNFTFDQLIGALEEQERTV